MSTDPDIASGCLDDADTSVTNQRDCGDECSANKDEAKKIGRSVRFPDEDQLVTEYFEPANPWQDVPSTTRSQLAGEYLEACRRHNTTCIDSVLQQIREFPESSIGGTTRAPRLILSECTLTGPGAPDALEAVLRKVQFTRIEVDHAQMDDEGAEALFDMIEYYESAMVVSLNGPRNFGIRGWQAVARMIKKSAELSELQVCGDPLEPGHAPVLARALRTLACRLRTLCLQQVALAGEPLLCLVIALKSNNSIRELRLCDNLLNVSDAAQIASLLRYNNRIQLLDLSNNLIQDAGCAHLADALSEQASQSPSSAAASPLSPHRCQVGGHEGRGLAFLILWNNQLTRNCSPYLSKILSSPSLCVLNIGRNAVGSEALVALLSLSGKRSLVSLGLQAARLHDVGHIALADIITHTDLQRLDLRENKLGVNCLQLILQAMQKNKTLTQIDLDDPPESSNLSAEDSESSIMSRLTKEIRSACRRNELASKHEDEHPVHRKISLTCHTTCLLRQGGCEEERRLVRLRSPLPSPAHSPAGSPVPHSHSRFMVTRVTPERECTDHSRSPTSGSPTSRHYCSTPSRFKVMQVMEPPQIQVHPVSTPRKSPSRFSVTRNYDTTYNPIPSPPPPSPAPPLSPIDLNPDLDEVTSLVERNLGQREDSTVTTDLNERLRDCSPIDINPRNQGSTDVTDQNPGPIVVLNQNLSHTSADRNPTGVSHQNPGHTSSLDLNPDHTGVPSQYPGTKCVADRNLDHISSTGLNPGLTRVKDRNENVGHSISLTDTVDRNQGATVILVQNPDHTTTTNLYPGLTGVIDRNPGVTGVLEQNPGHTTTTDLNPSLTKTVDTNPGPTEVPDRNSSHTSINASQKAFTDIIPSHKGLSLSETEQNTSLARLTDVNKSLTRQIDSNLDKYKLDSKIESKPFVDCKKEVKYVNLEDIFKQKDSISNVSTQNFDISESQESVNVASDKYKEELTKDCNTTKENVKIGCCTSKNTKLKDTQDVNVLSEDRLHKTDVISKDIDRHPYSRLEQCIQVKTSMDSQKCAEIATNVGSKVDFNLNTGTETKKVDCNVYQRQKALNIDSSQDINLNLGSKDDMHVLDSKSKNCSIQSNIQLGSNIGIDTKNTEFVIQNEVKSENDENIPLREVKILQNDVKEVDVPKILLKNEETVKIDTMNTVIGDSIKFVKTDLRYSDVVKCDKVKNDCVNEKLVLDSIVEDLGNIIEGMKCLVKDKVPVNVSVVLKKNKSESSLDSPDLEVSRLMEKKLGSVFDSSSSLEISGSSIESLNDPHKNLQELDRRKSIIFSNESSIESASEQTPNPNRLNYSVSSNDSVSPIFDKTKRIHESLSSLEASVSSLDSKEKLMVTSADSGIEYSLQHPTDNREDDSSNEGTLTNSSSLKDTLKTPEVKDASTSPKRTSSLLDVPIKPKGLDRVRKNSWVAPSSSFQIPKIEEKEKPSHLEKLLSLFQHPSSIFSRSNDEEKKSTSNTPPRKDSSLTSSFWSWGTATEKERDDDSSEATDSTLSERVQVSFVDESFSKKLDSKTPSSEDSTLSEYQSFLQESEGDRVTVTTEDNIVQNIDISVNKDSVKEIEKDEKEIVRPRSFAAVLKSSGSENSLDKQNSPDNGAPVDKLPSKVIRGIKENISPENTLTSSMTNTEALAVEFKRQVKNPNDKEPKSDLAPIATIEETFDEENLPIAYIDDDKKDILPDISKEISKDTQNVDLGKDALCFIYENKDFVPTPQASLAEELKQAEIKEILDLSPELVVDDVLIDDSVFKTKEKCLRASPIIPERAKLKKSNSLEDLSQLLEEKSSPKAKSIAFKIPESTPRDIPERKYRTRSGSSPKSLPESLNKPCPLSKMDLSTSKKRKKVSSLGKMARDSLLALNMTEDEIAEFRRSYKLTSVESLRSLESVSEDANSQSGNSTDFRCRSCLRTSQESLMSLDSISEDCRCTDYCGKPGKSGR